MPPDLEVRSYLRPSSGMSVVDNPLLRTYFLGGNVALGVWPFKILMMFFLQQFLFGKGDLEPPKRLGTKLSNWKTAKKCKKV